MKIVGPVSVPFSLVLLLGCSSGGSGGSGGNQGPVHISSEASRSLTGQAAVFEAARSLTGTQSGPGAASFAAAIEAQSTSAADGQATIQGKRQVALNSLQSAVDKNLCTKELSFPAIGGHFEDAAAAYRPVVLKIKGPNCPLEVEFTMDMSGMNNNSPCNQSAGGMACTFTSKTKMTYQVRDEKLGRDLGVRSGSSSLEMKMNQANSGSPGDNAPSDHMPAMTQAMKTDANIDFKAVDLDGHVQLVSGTTNIDVTTTFPEMDPRDSGNMPMPVIKGVFKEDLRFLNQADNTSITLLASGKADGGTPQESYFINGAPVSAEQYMKEREVFAISLMPGGADQNQGHGPGSGPTPAPGPGPGPGPGPQPQPTPNPWPAPTPYPTPNPGPQPVIPHFACVLQTYTDHSVFIGYGAIQLAANSKAKQLCQGSSQDCSGSVTCEEQERNPEAYFCEVKNYSTNRVYGGSGASKVEAFYKAAADCYSQNGNSTSSCQQIGSATCAHQ